MKNGQGRLCATAAYWGESMTGPDGQAVTFGCDFDPYDDDRLGRPAVREHGLAVELLQPGDARVHHVRRQRPRVCPQADPGGVGERRPAGGIGAGVLTPRRQHPGDEHGQLLVAERDDEQVRLPPGLERSVLQRQRRYGLGADVRRSPRNRWNELPGVPAGGRQQDRRLLWSSTPMAVPAAAPPIIYSVNGKAVRRGDRRWRGSRGSDRRVRGSYVYAYALPSS